MRTERDRLVHRLDMAQRDLQIAEAAADPSKVSGDCAPSEAPPSGMHYARIVFEAAKRALEEYDQRNKPFDLAK